MLLLETLALLLLAKDRVVLAAPARYQNLRKLCPNRIRHVIDLKCVTDKVRGLLLVAHRRLLYLILQLHELNQRVALPRGLHHDIALLIPLTEILNRLIALSLEHLRNGHADSSYV